MPPLLARPRGTGDAVAVTTEDPQDDALDVAIGVAVAGVRVGSAAGRVALLPARVALRTPVLDHLLRRAAEDLAADGRRVQAGARARMERSARELLASPEFELAVDRAVGALLDHELTERAVRRALASPGLERLVVEVLDSRFVDGMTERVLDSPEMDRVVEHIATSPQVVDAISRHTQTLAEEMVADVRRRTVNADEFAERAVRGWLRRPRPSPS